jgi:tight adherence protein C
MFIVFPAAVAAAVFCLVVAAARLIDRNEVQEALDRHARPPGSVGDAVRRLAGKIGGAARNLWLLRDFMDYPALENRLRLAGCPVGPQEWIGAWLAGGTVLFLAALALASSHVLPAPFAAVLPLAGIVLPKVILDHRVHRNRRQLEREFLVFVEKVALGMSAGVPFLRVFEHIAAESGYLGGEAARLVQEINAGVPADAALASFAGRLETAEADDFVLTMRNALKHGGSAPGETLLSLAKDMWCSRESRIDEIARKMESKLVIPVVLAVLPATTALVVGPLAVTLLKAVVQ